MLGGLLLLGKIRNRLVLKGCRILNICKCRETTFVTVECRQVDPSADDGGRQEGRFSEFIVKKRRFRSSQAWVASPNNPNRVAGMKQGNIQTGRCRYDTGPGNRIQKQHDNYNDLTRRTKDPGCCMSCRWTVGGVGQVTAAGPMRSGNRCVDGGRGKRESLRACGTDSLRMTWDLGRWRKWPERSETETGSRAESWRWEQSRRH